MFTVVTGGSASGKSEYAENLIVGSGVSPLFYVATMIPSDDECKARIARHRELRREKGFSTVECPIKLNTWHCPPGGAVLLECMSNLAANEYYNSTEAPSCATGAKIQKTGASMNATGADTSQVARTADHILCAVEALSKNAEALVIVTNDIFADGVDYPPETMGYLDCLSRINCGLAVLADRVVEVVCTLPIFQKGGPPG